MQVSRVLKTLFHLYLKNTNTNLLKSVMTIILRLRYGTVIVEENIYFKTDKGEPRIKFSMKVIEGIRKTTFKDLVTDAENRVEKRTLKVQFNQSKY